MIAIYARQSIFKKDSISIETQINNCKCKLEPNEQFEIYQDAGWSGKNVDRPDFQRLMKDVNNGKIHKILVYKLDRISRSVADFSSIWAKLEKNNVSLESISEKFDTSSPMGKAMQNIIMTFAQFERETIAQRIKDNYYSRAENIGCWLGGPAPYGFQLSKEIRNGKKISILVEDSNTSEVVKEIFNIYEQPNTSLGYVAKTLNKRGIKCANRDNWDNVSISRILHNPVYVKCDESIYDFYISRGVLVNPSDVKCFDGTKAGMLIGKRINNDTDNNGKSKYRDLKDCKFYLAAHNGYIESNVWIKCARKLESNKQIKNVGKGKYSYLSGLLKCGNCGYSIKIQNTKDKRYLICSGRTNLKNCVMSFKNVDLSEIEAEVEKKINEFISRLSFNINQITKTDFDITKEIEEKKKTISELIQMFSSDSPEYTKKLIQARVREIEQEINQLQNNRNIHIASNQISTIPDFHNLNFDEKKAIASELIDKIDVGLETTNINWKY